MLIGKPVRQVVVPTTLELFDYWLLHDFVKRYASMQIVSKNMIGAPPGVRPAQVLPNVDGVMTSSGTRVFAFRGSEYNAHYCIQRPINDGFTSISDEFGTGAEILVVQRRPDRLQVFFRDIEAGWLEERFITWLGFAYPETEFVQPAPKVESSNPPGGLMMPPDTDEAYWREVHKLIKAYGNISAYCRETGMGRQTYYDAKRRYGLK